ncbi:MAG: class I SAM-dependent methyltransferase [Bacteroidales bacterium]|nr:class I SAM-dependent methyltransferase [Bacteroidales bacterium]
MNKIHISYCPVCNSQQLSAFTKCNDHSISKEDFQIMKCDNCGFLFTQDFPDESLIGEYYKSKDYISHSNSRKGLINNVYHIARTIMLNRKAKIVCKESGMEKGKLLDIGCGTGYFLHTMKKMGWDVMGVEKSDDASKVAKEHFNIDVKNLLNEVDDNNKYDVITLWHVMEHLQDLKGTFEKLRSLLKDDGTLIVAVPNSESFDAEYYKENWAAYDVPRHLWHFNATTLGILSKREEFKIEKFGPMPLDAFYISMLSEKLQGKSCSFFRGMLIGIKALNSALTNPRKSSSLIFILRKSK